MTPCNINFINELEKLRTPVWEEINKYLPNKWPFEHYKIVRDYPERKGKYFRPGLLLLSAQMFGGEIEKALLSAAAIQISEDWLLVHDDVEDHSKKRRGETALNILYGYEIALNAGDALHIIMWKILGDNARKLGYKLGWEIYDKINDIILTTTEGQFIELDWIRKKKISISEDEYYQMIYIKAGYYTVTGPLQLGAIIACANADEIKRIEDWGIPFGSAFQIWDDVMNILIPSDTQGKERGGDILEGKRSLILIHLLKNCSDKERRVIESIYLKTRENKTEEEKEYIINLMETYGSVEYAKKKAYEFAYNAEQKFSNCTLHLKNNHAKETIKSGIKFVVNRNY